jgi:hypothetical protein
MKSYTDLNQSKKLAEILPLESADMYYCYGMNIHTKGWSFDDTPTIIDNSNQIDVHADIPCWSLAALLNVLPNNEHIDTTISRGSWKIEPVEYLPNIWWCEYEDTKNQTEFNISADNPVDACYEMIVKLNELKML